MRGPGGALLVVVVWLSSTLVAAPPAAAATCPAPGGQPITRTATQTAPFVVVGGGYGHGVGMSQWGARGAALLGCSRRQILAAYYPGAVPSSVPSRIDNIRVSLIPSSVGQTLPSFVDVQAVSDRIAWRLNGVTRRQRAGETWRASVGADGRYTVKRGTTTVFSAARGPLRITLSGKVVRLPVKGQRYNRGRLLLTWAGSGSRTSVTAAIAGIDRYLYGLAEMQSQWPQAALRAQAVAGRTYALQRRESRDLSGARWMDCRCDVYDSVSDQVYRAYEWESLAPRWVEAVNATAQSTLRHDGETITAFYHSSSGGHTASSAFVFGQSLAYSTGVDDSRWERASGNPNTTWERTFSAAALGTAFGMGRIVRVATPAPKGPAGRIGDPKLGAGGVVLTDANGNKKTVSGPEFRLALNLQSALFKVVAR